MSNQYLRLTEKPGLNHPGYPTCDACAVETTRDDDEWLCPSCGTTWPGDNAEAAPEAAQLFPEWSGEELTGPVCPNEIARLVSGYPPSDRDRLIAAVTGADSDD